MSTRSDIVVQLASGKWARIYCHWDGYVSHNGRILFDHYTSQAMVEKLITPGDISSLGPRCDKPRGHTFEKRVKNCTTYYGRDRGEKDVAPRLGDTIQAVWPESDTWTEFTYVWFEEKWWVGDPDEGSQALLDLGDVLTGKRTLAPLVKMFGGIILGRHTGQVDLTDPTL